MKRNNRGSTAAASGSGSASASSDKPSADNQPQRELSAKEKEYMRKIAEWALLYHQIIDAKDSEVFGLLAKIPLAELDEFERFSDALDEEQYRFNQANIHIPKEADFNPDRVAYLNAKIQAMEKDISVKLQRRSSLQVEHGSLKRKATIKERRAITESTLHVKLEADGRIDATDVLKQFTAEQLSVFQQANALAQSSAEQAIEHIRACLGMNDFAHNLRQYNLYCAAIKTMEATQSGANGITTELQRRQILLDQLAAIQAQLAQSDGRIAASGIELDKDGSAAIPVPPAPNVELFAADKAEQPGIVPTVRKVFGAASYRVASSLWSVTTRVTGAVSGALNALVEEQDPDTDDENEFAIVVEPVGGGTENTGDEFDQLAQGFNAVVIDRTTASSSATTASQDLGNTAELDGAFRKQKVN